MCKSLMVSETLFTLPDGGMPFGPDQVMECEGAVLLAVQRTVTMLPTVAGNSRDELIVTFGEAAVGESMQMHTVLFS